jgi:cytosine/uracil/thiamine/allantoin permease
MAELCATSANVASAQLLCFFIFYILQFPLLFTP